MSVKPIEAQYTDKVPEVNCHLLSSNLDFLKVLICQEDEVPTIKLTCEAQEKLEIEKQKRVKTYMDDIIRKLTLKERKHKISVKRKFVDEALMFQDKGLAEKRTAQVYVIVINREKDYDPVIS